MSDIEIEYLFNDAWSKLDADECFDYLRIYQKILDVKVTIPRKIDNNDYQKYESQYDTAVSLLTEEFFSCAGHSVVNLFRNIGWADEMKYKDILLDCASEMNVKKVSKRSSTEKIEEEIAKSFLNNLWEHLDEEARKKFVNEIAKETGGKLEIGKLLKSGAPIGTILLGQSSGFAIYIAATTTLGAITSALGITLPFAAYTGLTSGISALLGPIGWVMGGVWAVYKLGSPNHQKKLIPCIILFLTIRSKINIS